jgi:hypothetical protein
MFKFLNFILSILLFTTWAYALKSYTTILKRKLLTYHFITYNSSYGNKNMLIAYLYIESEKTNEEG